MKNDLAFPWKLGLSAGSIAGGIALLVSLVGLVELFSDSYIIQGLISVGEIILYIPLILLVFSSIQKISSTSLGAKLAFSALMGVIMGVMLSLLVIIGSTTNIREMFINASPALFNLLTRGVPLPIGALIPPIICIVVAWISLGIFHLPDRFRKPVIMGFLWVVVLGTLRDQILLIFVLQQEPIRTILRFLLFAQSGLSLIGALIVFAVTAGSYYYSSIRSPKGKDQPDTPSTEETPHNFIYVPGFTYRLITSNPWPLFYGDP